MDPDTDHWGDVVWENWDLAMKDLREKRPVLIYDFAPSGFHYWGKYRLEDYPIAGFVDSFYTPCDSIHDVVADLRRDRLPGLDTEP